MSTRDDRDPAAQRALPVDLDDLGGLLASVLVAEGAPVGSEASLQLVSPATIAELKARHLDGDGAPTDVLSFPIDGITPDVADTGDHLVGDVVVCPDVAARQAAGHAGDLSSELALLVVHGALHLCGWDHATSSERTRMWRREQDLLDGFGRTPVGDPWGTL